MPNANETQWSVLRDEFFQPMGQEFKNGVRSLDEKTLKPLTKSLRKAWKRRSFSKAGVSSAEAQRSGTGGSTGKLLQQPADGTDSYTDKVSDATVGHQSKTVPSVVNTDEGSTGFSAPTMNSERSGESGDKNNQA
jgi:hypothetical protein